MSGDRRERRAGGTRLRLLRGAKADSFRLAGVTVAVARPEEPPFVVDARAVEDDTYLVLGADPGYRAPTEHPLRVLTAAHEARPAPLGTVVARSGEPWRLHAVVHDLARSPTWTEEWVGSALVGIVEAVEKLRFRALALPCLGGQHGTLEIDRFLDLLSRAIQAARPTRLRRIWLSVSTDQARRAAGWLDRATEVRPPAGR